jgi:hypothetical protein
MIFSGSAFQTNGLGRLLCSAMKRLMAACRSTMEWKTPRFNRLRVSLAKTGQTHDWSVSAEFVRRADKPVFLAGGLNPGNVAQRSARFDRMAWTSAQRSGWIASLTPRPSPLSSRRSEKQTYDIFHANIDLKAFTSELP